MFKTRLKSTEANPRALYLDVVRAVACLMVVVIHAPMPNIGTPGNVLSSVSLLMAPCVPLFFMVSGALLLPSSLGMGDFMRRRLGRVLWPTLGWTAFYIVLNTCKGGGNQ